MALSIKGKEIRDTADGGKVVERGTGSHREAVHAAQEQSGRSSRGAKSVGYPDTPEVARAFNALRRGSKSDDAQHAEPDADNKAADAADEEE